ncbi:MAG: peroxiredoxin [Actinomycetota bacterium]
MTEVQAGTPAPDFEAEDADGKVWRLGDLKGQKVILYFYPADDTPGCTKESCDFRDSHADFKEAGYIVLGASPQGADSHAAFASKYSLDFPLLIDEDMTMAKAYGVAEDRGDWEGIPLRVKRSTFVIDENGTIEQALYGVNARSHVADLLGSLAT